MSPEERKGLQARVREAARMIGQRDALRLVVLFGSAAVPSQDAPADIDLALKGDGLLNLVELTNRFIQETGVQEIDLVDLTHADPLLLALVARDGLPLYEAEPGMFARFASLAARRFADTRKFRDAEANEVTDFIAGRPAG